MLKKVLTIILTAVLLLQMNVYAAQETYTSENEKRLENVMQFLIENENLTISRGDCIAVLLKVIGVDEKLVDIYANADFCMKVFGDIGDDDANAGYIIMSNFKGISTGIQVDKCPTYNFLSQKECYK